VKKSEDYDPEPAEAEAELLDDNDAIEVATHQAKGELGDLKAAIAQSCSLGCSPSRISDSCCADGVVMPTLKPLIIFGMAIRCMTSWRLSDFRSALA
jgi:hypothetical protein